jgi:uncharacterized OsmC-like protein
MSEHPISLKQQQDYRFEVGFGAGLPALQTDEGPPLGQGAGPTPVQLLGAAVGNCLSASLVFALRKFKLAAEPLQTTVEPEVGRNAEGRLRVLSLKVVLTLGAPAASLAHLDRVLGGFEAYCTVTQSVAPAIAVEVQVFDSLGARLK